MAGPSQHDDGAYSSDQMSDSSSSSRKSDRDFFVENFDDNDSVSEVNEDQFCQHNYLFLFDSELSLQKDFPDQEVLTPEQFQQMKTINRRKICEFYDYILGNEGVMEDIVVEVSHCDGPGEEATVKKKIITFTGVEDESGSSRSKNTDF